MYYGSKAAGPSDYSTSGSSRRFEWRRCTGGNLIGRAGRCHTPDAVSCALTHLAKVGSGTAQEVIVAGAQEGVPPEQPLAPTRMMISADAFIMYGSVCAPTAGPAES